MAAWNLKNQKSQELANKDLNDGNEASENPKQVGWDNTDATEIILWGVPDVIGEASKEDMAVHDWKIERVYSCEECLK